MGTTTHSQQIPLRPMPRWLAGFARVTSGHALLPEVDGLRFLAIAAVVLFHMDASMFEAHGKALRGDVLSRVIHHVLQRGYFGVPLFFSISGFILMLPFARAAASSGSPVRLGAYFLRRLTRLEPPYILCMVVLSFLTAWHFSTPWVDRLPNLLASLAYVHNLAYGKPSLINEVAWSLEIEVQFYCLAPVLALLFRLPPVPRRLAMVGLGLTACAFNLTPLAQWKTLLTYGQHFLVGMFCADLHANGWARRLGSPGFDALFVAGLALPVLAAPPPASALWHFLGPVSLSGLLAGTLWSVQVRRLFQHPVLFVIGGMCYTIYLWHSTLWLIAWHRIDQIGHALPYWAYFVLQSIPFLGIVLGVCGVLFRLFERPFMQRDWPSRLGIFIRTALKPASAPVNPPIAGP